MEKDAVEFKGRIIYENEEDITEIKKQISILEKSNKYDMTNWS